MVEIEVVEGEIAEAEVVEVVEAKPEDDKGETEVAEAEADADESRPDAGDDPTIEEVCCGLGTEFGPFSVNNLYKGDLSLLYVSTKNTFSHSFSHSFLHAQARTIVEGVIDQTVADAVDAAQSKAPPAEVVDIRRVFTSVHMCMHTCILICSIVDWFVGDFVSLPWSSYSMEQ